jgi:hypothetical protein
MEYTIQDINGRVAMNIFYEKEKNTGYMPHLLSRNRLLNKNQLYIKDETKYEFRSQ